MRCWSGHGLLSLVGAGLLFGLGPGCSPADPGSTNQDTDVVDIEPETPPVECAEINPAPAQARLMTGVEYDNSVFDLLGDASNPSQAFPPENTVEGFGNNEEAHQISLLLAERLMVAAEAVAASAVSTRLAELTTCDFEGIDPAELGSTCVRTFIRDFGKRAFRRPLTDNEHQLFMDLFARSLATYGSDKAVEHLIQAVLQSPQFLYRATSQSATPVGEGIVRLGGYEVASRLSYFIWNSLPDDELLDLAQADGLATAEAVEQQARRMLEHPRAKGTVDNFYRQWLGLSRFNGLVRNLDSKTPASELAGSWRASLQSFATDAFWQGGGTVEALLLSPTVFLDSQLAPLYGVETPEAGQWVNAGDRRGLLTQPGLMALLAHPNQSAPVQRGVFVREQLMCDHLPPPPPDVDSTPPDPNPNATTRERFSIHTEDARCAGCHALIDPVGFGFEQYDHLGRFRETENGETVDVSGAINGTKDVMLSGEFNGVSELSDKLVQSERVQDCIAVHWYRYGLGHVETDADLCSLQKVQTRFRESGGNLKELIVSLAVSDAFRYRPSEEHDL